MARAPSQWVSIGPTRINDGGQGTIGRIHSIAVHPTTPSTVYVGGPGCGIWKTTNGGVAWAAVGDGLPTLALAALAVDPVTPTRVYAVLAGAGVYRSDDAAATWARLAGDLGTPAGAGVLLIDPRTPSTLFLTGKGGLFRSTDSGAHWVLSKTGAVYDVVMDPTNPATLYASVISDGVYKTTTGGVGADTGWKRMPGLPVTGFDGVTLALCPAVPTTIYAGLSGSPFRVFRSTDGATFGLRYSAPSSIFNPWLGVDPRDPSIVYLPSANFQRSTDGGATFVVTSGDLHECQKIATDPVTSGVVYLGRDSGIFRSSDQGQTFKQMGSGIANVQFYDGAVAATSPTLTIGGTQDNGTIRYPGTGTEWTQILGGDGATVAIDPTNANILYAMNQYPSSVYRSTDGGSFPRDPNFAAGLPTGTDCFNFQFLVHPAIPTTLLGACRSLWRITSPDGTWTSIFTPTGDSVVHAAVDGSVDLYYAGSAGGKVYAGPHGGSWQQVFAHPAGAAVADLSVDPGDPSITYATFGGTQTGRVYRMTRDSAAPSVVNAVDITANLPAGPVTKIVADRMVPLRVYVGTNQGVYQGSSTNGGATWSWRNYNNGLPPAAVADLEVHPGTGVMRVFTFGRGAYEVDTDPPVGSLLNVSGRITFLRVNDVGTGFGPANDFLDVEAVIQLDTKPGYGFGFQMRTDSEEAAREGMLDLLRRAFNRNRLVTVDYIRTGFRNGRITRVGDLP